jgi:hypothetical protein
MQIIINIPDNKVNELKKGVLKAEPIPLDSEGNPTMTALEWVHTILKDGLRNIYRQGIKQIWDEENNPVYEDVIT